MNIYEIISSTRVTLTFSLIKKHGGKTQVNYIMFNERLIKIFPRETAISCFAHITTKYRK